MEGPRFGYYMILTLILTAWFIYGLVHGRSSSGTLGFRMDLVLPVDEHMTSYE